MTRILESLEAAPPVTLTHSHYIKITFTVPLPLYYLGHSELGELGLKIIELLGEIFLLLLAKLGALDLTHFVF